MHVTAITAISNLLRKLVGGSPISVALRGGLCQLRFESNMTEARPPFMQPNAIERFFNRFFGTLVGWGLGPSYNYLLQVEGRKTGRIYSTPVNVVDFNGKRFLVAPRGETQWVRNARANKQLWLKKGRTRLRYSLREIRDHEKPEILREYLNRYKTTVQRYFPVAAGSPSEAFLPLVTQYPTFELLAQ